MAPALTDPRSYLRTLRRYGLMLAGLTLPAYGVWLLVAPSAMANCCFPKAGGSPNANSIKTLYIIIFVLAIFVFVSVTSVLLYSVYSFRAKKHPVAVQIHGNTKLELGLTAGAAVILVILAAATFIKLPSIVDPPNSNAGASAVLSASLGQPTPPNGRTLTICVTGRQFIWRYTYGADCNKKSWEDKLPYSYTEMVVPAGVTVRLVVQSSDVIHSWWVPSLGGKVDAVPGFTVYTWFKALHANELYHGQCAQLCGKEHAFMVAEVKVDTPKQYTTWIKNQTTDIQAQNDQVAQLRQDLTKQGILAANSNGVF
jgi:cytochrome c oxidase subunit II